MKILTITIISILALNLLSCLGQEKNEVIEAGIDLSVDYEGRGYYMLPGPNPDSTIVYHLNIEIINSSRDTVSFVSMSCSHHDMFIVEESDLLAVHPYYNCFSNFPILISLSPSEAYLKSIMIRPIEKSLPKSINTKIGFQYFSVDKRRYSFDEIIDKYQNRYEKG